MSKTNFEFLDALGQIARTRLNRSRMNVVGSARTFSRISTHRWIAGEPRRPMRMPPALPDQAKCQRAEEDKPQHDPVISRVFESVQGDAVENAAAQRQGHVFGDVNRKISETSHRGKDRFERHDGDERDQNLRTYFRRAPRFT